ISGYRPYGVASHNCVFSAAIRMHCILPIPPALRAVNIGCCGRSLLYLCRTGKLDTGVVGVGSVYRFLAFTLADQVVTIGSSGEVVIVFSLSSPMVLGVTATLCETVDVTAPIRMLHALCAVLPASVHS